MKTFKITLSENYKYSEQGYFTNNNHLDAINSIDKNVTRINNQRFREIEITGKFYFVTNISKSGKTLIYECN
jgi:hypothetical protein